MSYEGYVEVLCRNGHRRMFDCWDDYDTSEWRCSCGEPSAWQRQVDVTNGTSPDEPWSMPYPFVTKREAETAVCNLGHTHVLREIEYEIPTGVIMSVPDAG